MARIAAWVSPTGPLPGESAGGEPALAVTPRRLAGQVNALIGWRALRWGTRCHQVGDLLVDVPHPDATDDPGDDAAWAYGGPQPIRWTRSPASRAVWVGVFYAAHDAEYDPDGGPVPSGVPPSIEVELQDAAGLTLDGPLVWDLDNGRLEVSENMALELSEAVAGAGGNLVDGTAAFYADESPPDRFVQTGWDGFAVDDEPRLLELPEGGHGTVQLVVTGTVVRIHSIVWAEAFLSEL